VTSGFHKAGVLIIRDNRILLCRKKYFTSKLILPGGCYEPGESPEACMNREIREELGDVHLTNLQSLGTWRDQAAGAPEKTVQIDLYSAALHGEPSPQSEIRELVWFGPSDDREQLSPSIRRQILPDLIARGILPWPEIE
jgi:ADP-ribose pyrophosphatase YjhB (NUDIX family)